MLFRPLAQRIADYLNLDGKLDTRKTMFCILNMGSSGGIIGLLMLIVLALIHKLTLDVLIVETVLITFGSWASASAAFRDIQRNETPGLHPSKWFVRLCMMPFVIYMFVTAALVAYVLTVS